MDFYNTRFDFLKLESEDLPSGENVVTGSTCYEVDTGKFYIYYKTQWYDQTFEE